jgi:hypothetical protein
VQRSLAALVHANVRDCPPPPKHHIKGKNTTATTQFCGTCTPATPVPLPPFPIITSPISQVQVVHSLWHSNALPSRGEHVREADALALMMHVQDCVTALRWVAGRTRPAVQGFLPPCGVAGMEAFSLRALRRLWPA